MTIIVESAIKSPEPIELLRDACQWAAFQNMTVAIDGGGFANVFCATTTYFGPVWLRRDTTKSIDPLAALLLKAQPEATDPLLATRIALGCGEALVAGLIAGIDKEEPSILWTRTAGRQLFLQGFQAGSDLRRDLLSLVCPEHGERYTRGKACQKCTAEAAAAGARS